MEKFLERYNLPKLNQERPLPFRDNPHSASGVCFCLKKHPLLTYQKKKNRKKESKKQKP